jgi:hypothetical protein
MGIYNLIHDFDDDLYYYCPTIDCPCHSPDYHDSSRNNYYFYDLNNNHIVNDDNNDNSSSDNNFCGELN